MGRLEFVVWNPISRQLTRGNSAPLQSHNLGLNFRLAPFWESQHRLWLKYRSGVSAKQKRKLHDVKPTSPIFHIFHTVQHSQKPFADEL